jgi:predicted HTH transcriptional regulator
MVEQRGFGMETWNALPEEFDLPIPEYSLNNSFLEIQFATSLESKRHLLDDDVRDKLNDEELKGYEFVKVQGSVSRKDYEEHFGYDSKKASRHLSKLRDLGLIGDNGESIKSNKYRYVNKG